MNFVAQVFTGGWKQALYTPEEICSRLEQILKKCRLEGVIIGWNLDREIYRKVNAWLAERGIRSYLWMPCFSETGELFSAEEVRDIMGNRAGNYTFQEGESFRFYCPSSAGNQNMPVEIYERYFADCGFDGVFLDKVRSQSMVADAADVFSCCCGKCEEIYRKNGCDLKEVRAFIEEKGLSEALRPVSFDPAGGFEFRYPVISRFFEAKQELYYRCISDLTDSFRARGLRVGLDLYAPGLCALVGQDFERLCRKADFVKPMMYRRTEAPAGEGFELDAFRRAAAGNPEALAVLDAVDMRSGALMAEQLDGISPELKFRVYPGIEVNYQEKIAETDAEYVRESLRLISQGGVQHAVLAWNVMLAPDEHISAAAEMQS